MQPSPLGDVLHTGDATGPATGALAIAFQEALTVGGRLVTGMQQSVASADLRRHVKGLIRNADDQAKRAGYTGETVRLATYAVIGFLDEAVLGSGRSELATWAAQPLQEEIFNDNVAGNRVFENLRNLMAQPDSPELGDLLELHQMCLLLGFRGRHGSGDEDRVRSLLEALDDRIYRMRKKNVLAPDALPPAEEEVPIRRDPWVRRLVVIALAAVVAAVVVYLAYSATLANGVRAVRSAAGGG